MKSHLECLPVFVLSQGLQVDTAKAEPGILKKIKDTLAKYPGIKAILLECTELPPYSDSLREQTGLPVYDAITCCDAIMSSFMDNARFGQDSWYKEWNVRSVAVVAFVTDLCVTFFSSLMNPHMKYLPVFCSHRASKTSTRLARN
jgi:hypothetical protein